MLANITDFFGCTCCHDNNTVVDWTTAYSLPKQKEEEPDSSHHVKIPLVPGTPRRKLDKARK